MYNSGMIKFRPHGTLSPPPPPWTPDGQIFETCAEYFFGKLLFLGIRGLNSLMFKFKLTQANYFIIATKCREDETKKSSRRPVFPVKSTVSKEEERNYQ